MFFNRYQGFQGCAVVSRVGCSENGVYVEPCRLIVAQEHTRVMVELDDDDRALDAIIKRVVIAKTSYPREVGLVEPRLNLF